MKLKSFSLLSVFLMAVTLASATVIENEFYDYKLTVDDKCVVTYEDNDSNFVRITSPDGNATFYIVTANTGEDNMVYKNEFMKDFDAKVFPILNRAPDDTDCPFLIAREDHYYNLEDAKVRTRTFIWNNKACLLAGFSKTGDMKFIDECIDRFESDTMLGKIATWLLFFSLAMLGLICYILLTEEDCKNQRWIGVLLLLGILLIIYLVFIYGDYTFNWNFRG